MHYELFYAVFMVLMQLGTNIITLCVIRLINNELSLRFIDTLRYTN